MKIYQQIGILFLLACLTRTAGAAVDCDDEAAALFQLAQQADQESRLTDARELYAQAAQRCDRADYWLAVGDIWSDDFLGQGAGDASAQAEPALKAYVSAYEAANREQNKPAGARASRAMVELGLRAGDPIKANEWLIEAKKLDPSAPSLVDLQAEVDFARQELSTDEIKTGMNAERGIVRPIAMAGARGWATPPAGSGEINETTVDMPVKFESNSSQTDARTSRNVENLASVLAQEYKDGQIVFIGHADVRGETSYNQWLSLRRAEAVRSQVEMLQPDLRGHIVVEGRGEAEPKDPGFTPEAHANNRRLEVVVN